MPLIKCSTNTINLFATKDLQSEGIFDTIIWLQFKPWNHYKRTRYYLFTNTHIVKSTYVKSYWYYNLMSIMFKVLNWRYLFDLMSMQIFKSNRFSYWFLYILKSTTITLFFIKHQIHLLTSKLPQHHILYLVRIIPLVNIL